MDQTLSPTFGNETISQTLQNRFNNDLLSPENYQSNRSVFEVILDKHPEHGIGITIVGGDSLERQGLGIFVKSVTVNGPAHTDGRIKPGDQIKAINDQSLEGVQHHKAVNMIKDSKTSVKLLVSQVKRPESLDRCDVDNTKTEPKHESSVVDRDDSVHKEGSLPVHSESASPNAVFTADEPASVYKANDDKENDNKKAEKDKNVEKKVFIRQTSIPECVSEIVDQKEKVSATVDIHSTLSQVDSLNSELEASEIPADHKQGRVVR